MDAATQWTDQILRHTIEWFGYAVIFFNVTYIYLHLSVEAIVEQQVVCHADSVGLHGMALTIVIVSNVT